jgi:hypothetical protein
MEILVARAEYTPVKQCEVNGPPLWVAEAAPIFLGSSTLLPSNVRHQSSCANDSTVNPQSLQRLQDLPVCGKKLIACYSLHFRTLSSHSLLAFSHVHAWSTTLCTCHHGKCSEIITLTVGCISQIDATGSFLAPFSAWLVSQSQDII